MLRSKDDNVKNNRFANDDRVAILKMLPNKGDGTPETVNGIIVGVYDGFLRVKIEGSRVPISVKSTDCYLISH